MISMIYHSIQIPVLVDMEFTGEQRQLMLWANRNAFFYVPGRRTGAYLGSVEFVRLSWAIGIDETGRPTKDPDYVPSSTGILVVLPTPELVFVAEGESIYALDDDTGDVLCSSRLGGPVGSPPPTYAVDDVQCLTIDAGKNVYAFGTSMR